MQRKKSFIIIGVIAGVIIIVSSVLAYSFLTYKPRPSETELPDQTIISNQKDLKEVKAFLNKYPDAAKIVDRSGPRWPIDVTYSVNNLSKFNATAADLEKDDTGRLIVAYRYIALSVGRQ